MIITGHTLKDWGFEPGPAFKAALVRAKELAEGGYDEATIRAEVEKLKPKAPAVVARLERGDFAEAIHAETEEEQANLLLVREHMAELMRTPVLVHGAVMPDACPAGRAPGTIPVGGAVISRGIHPAFHSSDICCSMHVTLFEDGFDPHDFMDALQASTRFGPGGRRPETRVPDPITDEIERTRNPFLTGLADRAKAQLADQGDGNHFAYLGDLAVTPELVARLDATGHGAIADALRGRSRVRALVTHHGSRDLGAQVYKRGIEAAKRFTARVSPDTPVHQSWLDPDSDDGALYWEALQYVARWTKRNHELVHELTAARAGLTPLVSFGNEHNFVWKRGDLFYHGKGATPAWRDDAGHPLLGVIPLNMASPILLTLGRDNARFCSFSPHGAGRNMSRTALLRKVGLVGLDPASFLARSHEILRAQTEGLDVRFFFHRPDVSETPVAYKSAATVRAQIEHYDLAETIGLIEPLGCLMAGDYDKPWFRKKAPRLFESAEE